MTIKNCADVPLVPLLLTGNATAMEPQDIHFISKPIGTEQPYFELLPPDFDGTTPRDVVIALHAHGSYRWQFIPASRG